MMRCAANSVVVLSSCLWLLCLSACDSPESSWKQAERQQSAVGYTEYAKKYPQDPKATLALQRADALTWPPLPGGAAKAPTRGPDWGNLSLGSGDYGSGWSHLFDAEGKQIGWGPIVISGILEIHTSLFSVSQSPRAYAANFFEVLYYNDSITIILIDSTKGHKMLWTDGSVTAGNSHVQYGGREYQLTKDGWYVTCDAFNGNRVLVRGFGKFSEEQHSPR